MRQNGDVRAAIRSNSTVRKFTVLVLLAGAMMTLATFGRAAAASSGCGSETFGQGRVASIIDARTLRLDDGREVRLSGIEPIANTATGVAELSRLVVGRQVTLHGKSDEPDRYGRQHAFVFLPDADKSVQGLLLDAGAALASGTVPDRACTLELATSETVARRAGRGVWDHPGVIKNAESSGDILARLGQFTLVEGKVVSARLAGSTFYVNFGRRWTRDFAVIIPRQMLGLLERDGIDPKSLASRKVRVRGWVEQRGGPRIEIFGAGQIEIISEP